MRLPTPDAIRTLQRQRYGQAKAAPGFRFDSLYDKIKIWRRTFCAMRMTWRAPTKVRQGWTR